MKFSVSRARGLGVAGALVLTAASAVAAPGLTSRPVAHEPTKVAQKEADAPKAIARDYLKALSGKGDDAARDLLLGGLTLTAEEVTIPNWRIVDRKVLKEERRIQDAVVAMKDLDTVGRKTLDSIVNLDGEEAMLHITQEQAEKMLLPTKRKAEAFQKKYPVFAYVARVGKDVFWHPANPWRAVVKKLGEKGSYQLEMHRFSIEESDGGKKRIWPLRVLRIRTKAYDSGWKILPASDWDPEY